MGESIHHEIQFDAKPERVFAALSDATSFSAMTGERAEMGFAPGSPFSQFDGKISGFLVETEPAQTLVQVWRAANWPPHHYSLVYFEFLPEGAGTKLVFDHVGFPPDAGEHLEEGWHKMVWRPLARYLAT